MLESEIQNEVLEWANDNGLLAYKFTTPSTVGVPDVIAFHGGRSCLVELKQKGKKAKHRQRIEIDKLKCQGMPVAVCDDVESACIFIAKNLVGLPPVTYPK